MDTQKLYDSLNIGDIFVPKEIDTWITPGRRIEKMFSKKIHAPVTNREEVIGSLHEVMHKEIRDGRYHAIIGKNKDTGRLFCFSFYNDSNIYNVEFKKELKTELLL